MSFGITTPILRIFDEAKAKEFYVDFLGFKVDWEHRFEEGLPLYMQISRDGCVYSEHLTATALLALRNRIETTELEKLQAELLAKPVCPPGNRGYALG